jgi:hypothetical protein
MGNGRWSATTYFDRAGARVAAGLDTFHYSKSAIDSGQLRVHQTLDPAGLGVRESRDSDEHPDSNAIMIGLDVTGSMGAVVRGIHADLPQLHELLLGHKYIAHPQILFAAVGDATCDRVPLQVGQFESDNRMDQNLENMILEGGGGGQKTESYELLLHVAANHTAIDCWEKRKRKGYLFIIGDEMAYPMVKAAEAKRILSETIQADIPLEQVIADAREYYHVYYVLPGGAQYGGDRKIIDFWTGHLGPHGVIRLQSPEDTAECIALTIGVSEGAISVNDGVDHLRKRGVVQRTIDGVAKALAGIFTGGRSDAPADIGDRARRL